MQADRKTKSQLRRVKVGPLSLGRGRPLAIISGPCVIESAKGCLDLARRLKRLADDEGIPLIFKASYDKANLSSHQSYRGPGLDEGLAILRAVKEETGLPLLTDVHAVEEIGPAAKIVDVLQIPAFLCRQTDLLLAAGDSG